MNLKQAADKHGGLNKAAIRHWPYERPVLDDDLGGYPTRGALTYTRALDWGTLGLSFSSMLTAHGQGTALCAIGIVPKVVVCGLDKRNVDGAKAFAEGIAGPNGHPPVQTTPAVTYPHYADFVTTRDALAEHEDLAVHLSLAGKIPCLWTEAPAVLEARLLAFIRTEHPLGSPVWLDINFEQMVVLYFRLLSGVELADIPCDADAWQPRYGCGLAFFADGAMLEFDNALNIINPTMIGEWRG